MRILLDESVPIDLASLLTGYDVSHVDIHGLKSLQNGELLEYARKEFECLITLDKGIAHQHAHIGHDLIILIIRVPNSA